MLAQYVSANQKDWDVWIPSVLFAYRTAVHDSTGFSPYKLLFGREPKQPIDFQIPLPTKEPSDTTSIHYFSALKRTLDSIQEQANQNLRTAQLSQKAYHDRGVTAEQFSIGDMVLVYNPVAHGSPKFQKHWEGPYLVVSKLAGGVTYMIRSIVDDKFLTVHRERLKLCNSEPVQEQVVQLIAAEPAEPDGAQPPRQLKLPNPQSINLLRLILSLLCLFWPTQPLQLKLFSPRSQCRSQDPMQSHRIPRRWWRFRSCLRPPPRLLLLVDRDATFDHQTDWQINTLPRSHINPVTKSSIYVHFT